MLADRPPVDVSLTFVDFFQRQPLEGLEIRGCRSVDAACEAPIFEGVGSDATGSATTTLFQGFEGYLEITRSDIVSTLFLLPPVSESRTSGLVGLIPRANLQTFNDNFNAGIDLDKGHIVARIHDCDDNPAADVKLVSDAEHKPFFMVAGLPDFRAERSGPLGVGGLLNVEASALFLSASVESDDGEMWTIAEASLPVRPTWATVVDLGPPISNR